MFLLTRQLFAVNKVVLRSFCSATSTTPNKNVTGQEDNNNNNSNKYPLAGVRILDLTRIVAGPYCTMILGDLGADVLKVERPGTGDESRKWGPPFLPNSTDSVYFMAANRNKRSICVDLKRGSDLIHALAAQCDVLVENYVPGKLAEYNLAYEQLRSTCPHLIYCSITGYGPSGPYAKRPGYDVIAASIGGLCHITGAADGPPAKVGVAMTDMATGLYAHGAILAALLQRYRTGRGQKIDVNLLSTQVASLINVASNYLNGGKEAKRWGTAHESIVPYEAFPTLGGGWLTVGAGSDRQFEALCQLLGLPELASDARFVNNKQRVQNRTELVDLLSATFRQCTSEHWMAVFEAAPFPVGPINNMEQVFADPHVRAVGMVKELQHSAAGTVRVVGPPVVYGEASNTARRAPPLLGEHTDEILHELLGYDDAKLNDLRATNIIQ